MVYERMADNQDKNLPSNMEIDVVLKTIISLVNQTGMEIDITLYVKGIIFSGVAISAEKYFDSLAKEIETANGEPIVTQAFAEGFRKFRDNITLLYKEKEDNKPDPIHVHLRNAKFISGTIFNPDDIGIYWRGRLDQVDGFSLGKIQ
ncbi:hypothetical protein Cylst_6392 (plasmid) [Cylindrospermum stagnale PCC 7417]|uniref:Gas vesicle protein n=1 Tax=Cylindrospermum stagnale PCC 7417 TaxID=56107 RepID=K9X7K7_9NOST|nr:gas vesicle accessory protein GvpU [Cylindrospermum stagnale]AFZ28610.1 hypothetical protein Cylst_6392 [Cylindrospermum stagnale PCC 7417]